GQPAGLAHHDAARARRGRRAPDGEDQRLRPRVGGAPAAAAAVRGAHRGATRAEGGCPPHGPAPARLRRGVASPLSKLAPRPATLHDMPATKFVALAVLLGFHLLAAPVTAQSL